MPKSFFFLEGNSKLVGRWTKCVAKHGDYIWLMIMETTSKNKTQTVSIGTLLKSYYKIPVI